MIPEPKIFYKTYLYNFHITKAKIYKKILEDPNKYEKEFFENELDKDESDAFRRTIMSDLRQTYFHSIETFFELFFALNPIDTPTFDDVNILFTLTHSNWRETNKKIEKIASGDLSLDFLENQITFQGYNISIGQYLFYYGLFDPVKISDYYFKKVKESIDAIKFGINIIARDFIKREEYNSYKHGLRIIPVLSEVMLVDPKTMEVKLRLDFADSMSFYNKMTNKNELQVVTKRFDIKRDFCMINFCSNLISHIVFLRQISMFNEQEKFKGKNVAIGFFGKKEIKECSDMNVNVQDFISTIRRSPANE